MGGSANPSATAAPRAAAPVAAPVAAPAQPNVFNQAAGAYGNALQGTQQVMAGYGNAPQAQAYDYTAATAGSQGYNAAMIAGMDLNPYLNPYTSTVINNSLRQLGDAQQTSLNTMGAQASAAGAFGGSRHGVAEGVTNTGYGQQASDMIGGLNQANFQNALNLAQYDTGSQNSARSFGAGAANNAALSNAAAQNAQRAQYAAAQAAASQANQNAYITSQQQQLAAAAQMGQLAQTGFGFGQSIGNQQSAQGGLQQGLNQMLIDAAKGQYAGWTGAPQASLGLPMAAVGGGAALGQGTTTQKSNPGLFDYLSSFAGILGGLGGR